MTAEGLNKVDELLGCHLCEGHNGRGARQKASEYEKIANNKLIHTFNNPIIVTQARVLTGFNGGMDFTIYWHDSKGRELSLNVEVDGEHHFEKPFQNQEIGEQRDIDEEKDRLVMEQKRRLVRLHYKDTRRWELNLKYGRQKTEKNPNAAFIAYSLSYNKNNVVTN